LSGYGQHIADAGTDAADYDFGLNLVSNEQDLLREVELALNRIFNGTYGICEVTGKPISRDRLKAVPFTRFSKEGQDQYEKTARRTVAQRVGITASEDDDGPAFSDDEPEEV
jgi:RNA polymerase-binding transcription factor DksA